jgi:hypothetical protein
VSPALLIVLKAVISGVLVASASEVAKRFPLWGAIMVSVPLTSLLTAMWIHLETSDLAKSADFLRNVFWAHLPTLVFFILCPILLRMGMNFWMSLALALFVTAIVFYLYSLVISQFGIKVYD